EARAVIQEQLRALKDHGTVPPRDLSVPDITGATDSRMGTAGNAPPPMPEGMFSRVGQDADGAGEVAAALSESGIMATHTSELLRPALPTNRTPILIIAGGLLLVGGVVAAVMLGGSDRSGVEPARLPEMGPSAAPAALATTAATTSVAALIEV